MQIYFGAKTKQSFTINQCELYATPSVLVYACMWWWWWWLFPHLQEFWKMFPHSFPLPARFSSLGRD